MRMKDLYTPEGQARYDKNRGGDICDICGRHLKNRKFYVVENHLTGELSRNDSNESIDSGDFHCVYIGSECAKLPALKGYVWEDAR